MATSKTFRVEFSKNGALRIKRKSRGFGVACLGMSFDATKDLDLRPGEYVFYDGPDGICVEVELVRHQPGMHLRGFHRKSNERELPLVRISVKLGAELNIVNGLWNIRRVDRRTYRDRGRSRA